jgi:ferritin
MDKKMLGVLNEQVNAEFYSANMYLAMSSYFNTLNLKGFANWMYIQYQEEVEHALKFFKYIDDRGEHALIGGMDAPETDFNSPLEVFEKALAHEKKVTAMIHNIYEVAMEVNDYPTKSFIKWFIDEQVEEESSGQEMVDNLKMIGDDKSALLILDREAGGRKGD